MWVVRAALASCLRSVIVVAGLCEKELRAALEPVAQDPRLKVTVNPVPQAGMASSLKVGLGCLEKHSMGAMILLADQPLITGEIIDGLIHAFGRESEKIIVPTIRGRKTTPVVFPRAAFPQLMDIKGDVGGRDVVNANPNLVVRIEMGSRYDDRDLDTPADLAVLATDES